MKQKIIKIREELDLKLGDNVSVDYLPGGHSIIISKKGETTNFSSVTPDFMRVVEKVNKKYGPALKELAKKST